MKYVNIYLVSLFENFLNLTRPNSIFNLSVTNLAKSLCELPLKILMLGILAQKILFSVVSILTMLPSLVVFWSLLRQIANLISRERVSYAFIRLRIPSRLSNQTSGTVVTSQPRKITRKQLGYFHDGVLLLSNSSEI